MSETRDGVRERIAGNLYKLSASARYGANFPDWDKLNEEEKGFFGNKADKLVLSIPELAIVDREAELPKILDVGVKVREWVKKLYEYYQTGVVQIEEYKQLVSASHILQVDTEIHLQRYAQNEMLKAGWVKEVL